jgi:hypothetical protein
MMKLMPLVDTWEVVEPLAIPEDMKRKYPIGAKLECAGAVIGVVIGYELKVLYNWKPGWLVTILFENGKSSSFEQDWMTGVKVKEIIKFNTAEELARCVMTKN